PAHLPPPSPPPLPRECPVHRFHDHEAFYPLKGSKRLRDHKNVSGVLHSRGMNCDVPGYLAELAHWQEGAITRKQLLDAGLTTKVIAHRLKRRRWQLLHRGVYAVFSGPPSRNTLLWAAVLRAGD